MRLFQPRFQPSSLSLLVFTNSMRHCLSLSLPFHGSSLDSSRLPREKLLLVPFRQKRGYNLQNLIPWTIGIREGGRETCFSFFFAVSCWYLADVFGFGRCSALLLIFSYRKNPRINGYALVCAGILFWCGCNFRGEIFNGRTLGWRRMRGR